MKFRLFVIVFFQIESEQKCAELSWITMNEIDSDYFAVERSANGIEWQILKKIESAGNYFCQQEYSFVDVAPLHGTSYYRLRQVDLNGSFSFSKVMSITKKIFNV